MATIRSLCCCKEPLVSIGCSLTFSFFFIYAQAYVSLCFSLMYDTESEEKHLDFITTNQQMVSLFFYFISVISLAPEQFFANKFRGGQETKNCEAFLAIYHQNPCDNKIISIMLLSLFQYAIWTDGLATLLNKEVGSII